MWPTLTLIMKISKDSKKLLRLIVIGLIPLSVSYHTILMCDGVSLEYVAVPQHGSFSFEMKLGGP
jgi:hypothetical protein